MSEAGASLEAYEQFRKDHPELFANPPDAAFEIVFDQDMQRRLGAGVIYRDGYYLLLRDVVRFRDGSMGAYIRFIPAAGNGGAAVLPVLDGRVILIRHQRHATRSSHWEIPRGFGSSGEPPEETARREIREELGVDDVDLVELGSVHPDTGASNVLTRLYLAKITKLGALEAGEGIDSVMHVTPEKLHSLVGAGEITDSFTLAAVLQAQVRGLIG